jgi:hypothetical protein
LNGARGQRKEAVAAALTDLGYQNGVLPAHRVLAPHTIKLVTSQSVGRSVRKVASAALHECGDPPMRGFVGARKRGRAERCMAA